MAPDQQHLTFRDKLKEAQALMDKTLEEVLPQEQGTQAEQNLKKALRYAALGQGKRIRPFLTLESARLFGVDERSALRAACAVELIHAFSLTQDDLPAMDNANLRRGKPSLHIAFDEATAILASTSLLVLAFEILAHKDTCDDAQTRTELILELANSVGPHGMCAGQAIDLHSENTSDLDLETAIRLQHLKTSCLLESSCSLGSILGHASKEARIALQGYAHDLGHAYQITDDLLDAESSSEEIGKPVGTDTILGKSNLVTLMGSEKAREHANILINQALTHLDYFGDKANSLKDLARHVLNRRN